jgi:hypothetical protein
MFQSLAITGEIGCCRTAREFWLSRSAQPWGRILEDMQLATGLRFRNILWDFLIRRTYSYREIFSNAM